MPASRLFGSRPGQTRLPAESKEELKESLSLCVDTCSFVTGSFGDAASKPITRGAVGLKVGLTGDTKQDLEAN